MYLMNGDCGLYISGKMQLNFDGDVAGYAVFCTISDALFMIVSFF